MIHIFMRCFYKFAMEEDLNKFKKLFCKSREYFCVFENISLSFKFCGNNGAIYFSCSERRDSYNIKILYLDPSLSRVGQ